MTPRIDHVGDPIGDAELVDLPKPRVLNDDERKALDFAVAAPSAPSELKLQAANAVVIAECSCPCGSIGLRTEGPAVPNAEPWALIEACARNRDGEDVQVNLHLFDGMLHELEIFGASVDGRVFTAPLDLSTLEYVRD